MSLFRPCRLDSGFLSLSNELRLLLFIHLFIYFVKLQHAAFRLGSVCVCVLVCACVCVCVCSSLWASVTEITPDMKSDPGEPTSRLSPSSSATSKCELLFIFFKKGRKKKTSLRAPFAYWRIRWSAEACEAFKRIGTGYFFFVLGGEGGIFISLIQSCFFFFLFLFSLSLSLEFPSTACCNTICVIVALCLIMLPIWDLKTLQWSFQPARSEVLMLMHVVKIVWE